MNCTFELKRMILAAGGRVVCRQISERISSIDDLMENVGNKLIAPSWAVEDLAIEALIPFEYLTSAQTDGKGR